MNDLLQIGISIVITLSIFHTIQIYTNPVRECITTNNTFQSNEIDTQAILSRIKILTNLQSKITDLYNKLSTASLNEIFTITTALKTPESTLNTRLSGIPKSQLFSVSMRGKPLKQTIHIDVPTGVIGDRGPRGKTGTKGNTGKQGDTGSMGDAGNVF